MELAVDIGNSFVKTGLFHKDHLIKVNRYEHSSYQRLLEFAKYHSVEHVIISSVKKEHPFNNIRMNRHFSNVIQLTEKTKLPITNLYKTPETLGKDRLAAVVGASSVFPESNILVIDMGSAITIDFINHQGIYKGGNISPGMNMRYKALHHFTQKLPLLKPQNTGILEGQNTNEAIHAGVQNGIRFEIEKYINAYEQKYASLITILTGGDSNFFDNKLNYTIFAESNLILKGLNKILKYNIYEI